MIAWSRVEELQQEIGEEDFQEIVTLFLDEVDTVVTRLREEPRAETLSEDLHFLKGSALNLGFNDFGTACVAGEATIRKSGPGDVDLPAILDVYAASRKEFLETLEARDAPIH